jgi:hypothetical protein
LQAKISSHPTTLIWLENLTAATPQQIFIEGLSAASTELKLTELSTFTPTQEKELTAKQSELANFCKLKFKKCVVKFQNLKL